MTAAEKWKILTYCKHGVIVGEQCNQCEDDRLDKELSDIRADIIIKRAELQKLQNRHRKITGVEYHG